jgi:hypothetical protein
MSSLIRRAVAVAAAVVSLCAGVGIVASPVVSAGSGWTTPERVTARRGSALTALHELASSHGALHLVHARIGPEGRDDRLVYQRSSDGGRDWSAERTLFASTAASRVLIPNLAIAADGDLVVVAWRARGPGGTTLFARRSEDGGDSWRHTQTIEVTSAQRGLGVPAVAVTDDVAVVAWTDRTGGEVRVRRSTDGGAGYGPVRSLATTGLSITCGGEPIRDGLVGLAAAGESVHLAWSDAPDGRCIATRILVRTSVDAGATWRSPRTMTDARTFGWAELAARGMRLLASVQAPDGSLVLMRSGDGGATFGERRVRPIDGHGLGAGDVLLPGGPVAWLAYPDLRYDGDDVRSSRVRLRSSSNGGATFGAPVDAITGGPKLREAPNLGVHAGRPIVLVSSAELDGSGIDIVGVRAR